MLTWLCLGGYYPRRWFPGGKDADAHGSREGARPPYGTAGALREPIQVKICTPLPLTTSLTPVADAIKKSTIMSVVNQTQGRITALRLAGHRPQTHYSRE
jgi:hypothetical protein